LLGRSIVNLCPGFQQPGFGVVRLPGRTSLIYFFPLEEVERILGKPHAVHNETREVRASRKGPTSESVRNEMFVRDTSETVEGVGYIRVYFDKDGLVVEMEMGVLFSR